jgi:cytochrome c biogenesis protein ResB
MDRVARTIGVDAEQRVEVGAPLAVHGQFFFAFGSGGLPGTFVFSIEST